MLNSWRQVSKLNESMCIVSLIAEQKETTPRSYDE